MVSSKSNPPFDPVLIPFDSTIYSEQIYFEIQLIVKLRGTPIDSLSQLFRAQYGLDVKPEDNLPEEFALLQNYPNPFNPNTNFVFHIAQSGFVSLKVFDVLGKEVVTLINEDKPAGTYTVNFNGSSFSSGIYFYSIKAGDFRQTKKMILVK